MRHALVLSPIVQDARNPAVREVLTSHLRPQRTRSTTSPDDAASGARGRQTDKSPSRLARRARSAE